MFNRTVLPIALVLVTLFLLTGLCVADELSIGSVAPEIEISHWVKGEKFRLQDSIKKGTITVIEFWATWCGPCLKTIPHLTELQKKYKELTIIGISDEEVNTVKSFVEDMGDDMDYTVAVDRDEQTSKKYLEATGIEGIPHAYIIDKHGKLVWFGHPLDDMEEVIKGLISGTFDTKKYHERKNEYEKIRNLCGVYLFLTLSTDEKDLIKTVANLILLRATVDSQALSELAREIAISGEMKNPDLDYAVQLTKKAMELSKNKNYFSIDTHATVLFRQGKKKEAMQYKEMAINLCEDPEIKEILQEELKELQQR